MRPILFNTEMVRAILDGRKSVTRRVVKGSEDFTGFTGLEIDPAMMMVTKKGLECPKQMHGLYATFEQDGLPEFPLVKAPYRPGDILYVRETWTTLTGAYLYKANQKPGMKNPGEWRPSIHMPKEATRLFLRVTNVRVERLQDITEDGARAEGAAPLALSADPPGTPDSERTWHEVGEARWGFCDLWNSTVKKADQRRYVWSANPWVWVIEFERISKEAGGERRRGKWMK